MFDSFDTYVLDVALNGPTDKNRQMLKELEAEVQVRHGDEIIGDSVAIVSGGLDSTTLVYDMLDKGYRPHLLSFNYGQRHKKELQFAGFTARNIGLKHDIVDLTGLTHLISNSALTSDHKHAEGNDIIEVPEGHYAEETMKATVVPNRNMIMLSIAAGLAVNNRYRTIGIGVHAGDHFVYPDCRPEFIFAAGQTILAGNKGFHNFFTGSIEDYREKAGNELANAAIAMGIKQTALPIYAPFMERTKANIAYRALELGVPLHLTWSCYKGGENHCGRCGTCVERLEAIADAQQVAMENELNHGRLIEDQTLYEDNEFWKTVTK